MRTGILLSLGLGASLAWYLTATAPGPVVAVQPTPTMGVTVSPTPNASPTPTPTASPTPTSQPTPSHTTPPARFSAPSGLHVVANTHRAVTVRWDAVPGAEKYTVMVNSEAIATIPRTTGIVLWNSRRALRITVVPVGADGTRGPASSLDVTAPPAPPQTGTTGPATGRPTASSTPRPAPEPSSAPEPPPPTAPGETAPPPPEDPPDEPAG